MYFVSGWFSAKRSPVRSARGQQTSPKAACVLITTNILIKDISSIQCSLRGDATNNHLALGLPGCEVLSESGTSGSIT